jgi:hypothetical protein
MTREEALDIINRLGAKNARLVLLERRRAEIDSEVTRLRTEIAGMTQHAANASEVLEVLR